MNIKYKLLGMSLLTLSITSCSLFESNQVNPPVHDIERPYAIQNKTKDLYNAYTIEKINSADMDISSQLSAGDYKSDSSFSIAGGGAAGLASSKSYYTGFSSRSRSNDKYNKIQIAEPQFNKVSESESSHYNNTNTESYDSITENNFHQSINKPLSTFSIDVDTASYSNMRRLITQGSRPPVDAIRIEELINYFDYDYTTPSSDAFAVNMEIGPALWNSKHKLVRIGIKGKEIKFDKRPASNLVFLIDVSGSMNTSEKLPLVKSSLSLLVDKLGENDKISIVVYAGAAGLVLPPTSGDNKFKILKAIDQLSAGGSTNGGQGIELAYKTATENFIKGGVNRVILATDGDFNVGTTNRDELINLVEKNGKKNIYLSILGFGMGNYKDALMETLSSKGNGNYSYIDNGIEARKVMVEQMSGTLVTIAKDVKLQVEFNPKFVASYRLIGYENRLLKNEDFNNDAKDAGDIGAGHTVTALYEIIPVGHEDDAEKSVDSLKYQKTENSKKSSVVAIQNDSNEMLTLKIRYKKPDGDVSAKQEFPLIDKSSSFENSSNSFRFASSVALFGMLLRKSEFAKNSNYDQVVKIAKNALGEDKNSYRQEFIDLVNKVKNMNN